MGSLIVLRPSGAMYGGSRSDPSVGGEVRKTRPTTVLSNDEANAVLNRVPVVQSAAVCGALLSGGIVLLMDAEEGHGRSDHHCQYPAALRARGVTHAALFGSRARGDAREDSDTDIMIEIDPEARIGVWDYVGDQGFIAGCSMVRSKS